MFLKIWEIVKPKSEVLSPKSQNWSLIGYNYLHHDTSGLTWCRRGSGGTEDAQLTAAAGLGHHQGRHPHRVLLRHEDQWLLREVPTGCDPSCHRHLWAEMCPGWRGTRSSSPASGLAEGGKKTSQGHRPQLLVQTPKHSVCFVPANNPNSELAKKLLEFVDKLVR